LVAYFPIPSILSAILLFLILPDCKKPTLVRMGRWGDGEMGRWRDVEMGSNQQLTVNNEPLATSN
jgi:hypothetical protein